MKAKFELGNTCVTRNVSIEMDLNPIFSKWVWECLSRHMAGDWGDLTEEDKKLNDEGLTTEERLFSKYENKQPGLSIYIITEADRSATTILFPEEY